MGAPFLRVWRFFVSSSRGVDERVSLSATRVSFPEENAGGFEGWLQHFLVLLLV